MALFSERYGYTKASDVIIREQITPAIQNAICTCFDKLYKGLFLLIRLKIQPLTPLCHYYFLQIF